MTRIQRTSSAAVGSRHGWTHHAWRLWLSLCAKAIRPCLGVGSSQGLHVVKARGLRPLRLWQFISGQMRRAHLKPLANGASCNGLLARSVGGLRAAFWAVGKQRFESCHGVLLSGQFGDALGDVIHRAPIAPLNGSRAGRVQLSPAVLWISQVLQQVLSHLLLKGFDVRVGHNDKHDNQIGQACQAGQFRPILVGFQP